MSRVLRRVVALIFILSCAAWTVRKLGTSEASALLDPKTYAKTYERLRPSASTIHGYDQVISEARLQSFPSTKANEPLGLTSTQNHPIDQLINNAKTEFDDVKARQSKTLEEAVVEYRKRYGIPPPPRFDRWYYFAKNRSVELIDEYDTIHEALTPFWALKPREIRTRLSEALGFHENANQLIGVLIRGGEIRTMNGGQDWFKEALPSMINTFVEHLPDMDLGFNIHDEPRVILQDGDLSRLVAIAREEAMPKAFSNEKPRNAFSPRPNDMNDGRRISQVRVTRFNVFAHQPTWTHSRLSCPQDSPARALGESMYDNITSYAITKLGFVYNTTAFQDICQSPSLRETYGFFDRPNAFNIVHDLMPVFSQSKVSSFQDILYPSPWYWYKKVPYDERKDMLWENKANSFYWRGSTTGGFSRAGGWRRQHRQRCVRMMNAVDEADIYVNGGNETVPDWQPKKVKRGEYKELIDVKFSHVGQCDPGDCDQQREFFTIAPEAGQQDAWSYKHLLDMDGNAFSGRFYAFLQSRSLVYKMALMQEWHREWLRPWVHYVPLSLRGGEWLEAVRYFSGEEEGKKQAKGIAEEGREWAGRALRNEDLEAWFFRLLLECVIRLSLITHPYSIC